MKWTKEAFDTFCAMKAEGASVDEIAEMLGCSRQSVYDKTKQLKKQGMAIAKKSKRKAAQEVSEQSEEISVRTADSVCDEAVTEESQPDGIIESADADKQVISDRACEDETCGCAVEDLASRYAELVFGAVRSAQYSGIVPSYVGVDMDNGAVHTICSGIDSRGRTCELKLTVCEDAER